MLNVMNVPVLMQSRPWAVPLGGTLIAFGMKLAINTL